jgi:hypothetical protein
MLRAVPVDLDELAGILEGDPLSVGGRIDIRTGEVWSQAAIEYAPETGEEDEDTADDPERWLAVHGEGSRRGRYREPWHEHARRGGGRLPAGAAGAWLQARLAGPPAPAVCGLSRAGRCEHGHDRARDRVGDPARRRRLQLLV